MSEAARKHSRHRATTRLAALLGLVLLLPAAQVASFVHLTLVRHATCPEHGELVEAAHAAPAHAVPSDHSVSPEAGPVAARHDHEHCPFGWYLRQGARAEAVAVSSPGFAPAPAVPVRVRDREPCGPALLRLAPKQSPPSNSA